MPTLELISHPLCPYVQRAVISLSEKQVPFTRTDIDLATKPEWFKALSPLGKVPLLRVDDEVLFESAVIVEYLEDTQAPALHPGEPLARARHRAWIEFGSTVLNDIWGFYTAADAAQLKAKGELLRAKLERLEAALGPGPFFAGERFSLVDAAFAPVFRYWELFDRIADFGAFSGLLKVQGWRRALAERPSVRGAVAEDYAERLAAFVRAQGSELARRMAVVEPA